MVINTPESQIGTERTCQDKLLSEILDSIKIEVPEVLAVLLVSSEGLPIASTRLGMSQDETILSAMTAALISVGEQVGLELDKGNPRVLIVKCPKGLIVLQRINKDVLITVVTQKEIRLGLLLLSLRKAKDKLDQVL
ncbi:MAG: roadblock/LC7 domain-containing protein [Candidatus Heimdallarchaeota archaeon]